VLLRFTSTLCAIRSALSSFLCAKGSTLDFISRLCSNKTVKRLLAVSLILNFLLLGMTVTHHFKTEFRKEVPPQRAPFYDYRNELLTSYPVKKGAVVFVGDSHVQFNEWSEMLDYPNILNRGIGGESTEQLKQRIASIALQHPEKMFIIAGTNDILGGVKARITLRNYDDMLSIIQKTSPETAVYVCAIFPTIWEPAAEVSELNDAIRRLARKYRYTFLDTFTPLLLNNTINPTFTRDGIHLNSKGYQAIKPLFLQSLNEGRKTQ
jgi:lysophospholipase L1-like esterase